MPEVFNPDNLFAGNVQPVVTGAVTIVSGAGVLVRGTVLGKITKALGAPVADPGNTGNGTLTGAALGKNAKIGNYVLTCITAAMNGGTFKVIDPDGIRLDDAVVGTAYAGPVNFIVNDGSVDFVVGDKFTIPVTAGSGKYKTVNSANVDGSGDPEVVLADESVDATAADKPASAYLTGEFNEDKLVFGGTDTKETHRAALRKLGIFLKKAVA